MLPEDQHKPEKIAWKIENRRSSWECYERKDGFRIVHWRNDTCLMNDLHYLTDPEEGTFRIKDLRPDKRAGRVRMPTTIWRRLMQSIRVKFKPKGNSGT